MPAMPARSLTAVVVCLVCRGCCCGGCGCCGCCGGGYCEKHFKGTETRTIRKEAEKVRKQTAAEVDKIANLLGKMDIEDPEQKKRIADELRSTTALLAHTLVGWWD